MFKWSCIILPFKFEDVKAVNLQRNFFRVGNMLADLLRECRKKKNVTQSETARFLGIELRTYVRYESGERDPSINTLTRMADFFDVSTDYLLGRDNNKKK